MKSSERQGVANEITQLEATLYEAMIRRDYEILDRLLSDDVLYIHSTGVGESKAEYFAGLEKGLYDYEQIRSRNVTIRPYSETAVMTGEVEMSVSARGQPKDLIRLLVTFIWLKGSHGWRIVLRQATRLPS
jgi:hypothetical protein